MAHKTLTRDDLIKIDTNTFEIPTSYRADMRVPARVLVTEEMLADILGDRSLEQLVNVTTLPGITKHALAMPDIHQGYGFPIGGVAAMAVDRGGVISPGGIGYDINCGVRVMVANMSLDELQPHLEKLATALFHAVPSGVGQGGPLHLNEHTLDSILQRGAPRMVELGYGTARDALFCEEGGCMKGADASKISEHAKKRGADQLGTLGSGNHFLEVQKVTKIYDEAAADAFGLRMNAVTVMIHCGSRGLGHQVCTDYVKIMMNKLAHWGINLPDKELACAPLSTPEGRDYFAAMAAASNFAWANRHTIGHFVRQAWQSVVGKDADLTTLYDVSHNIGKHETHIIDGEKMRMMVHRKGATRSFGPGHEELPAPYQQHGQPVFIPGTMGTASYILAGTHASGDISFSSSCHGAGRSMSRIKAKQAVHGTTLRQELEKRNIIVRCESNAGLAEEAPIAYKDIDAVVNIVHEQNIARKVVRLEPVAVIKGG